jgi:formylglycine-generating enzyme required for sulfatase activity
MLQPVPLPEATAEAAGGMKPYTERIPGSDASFDMVPIPGGKFVMGSPPGEAGRGADEGPPFEAEIEPFWMGKCEVTWKEYELWGLGYDALREKPPGQALDPHDSLADAITRPTKPYADMSFGMGKDGCPAIAMTHLAAKVYCKWLSAKTGRYYRLPTEAEWEYACRDEDGLQLRGRSQGLEGPRVVLRGQRREVS